MKKSPLPTVLLVVLLASALTSLFLCWSYISKTRELRRLQGQAAQANNNLGIINALATDALEYSKKNPAIDPILESAGVKPPRTGTAPAASPAKPATK